MSRYYPDEYSPTGPIPADTEAGRVNGVDDALRSPARGEYELGLAPTRYIPDPRKVAFGSGLASAASASMLFGANATPPKFADEYALWQGGAITFAPVTGMEGELGSVTSPAYDPYMTKEPKQRGAPPTGASIANNIATATVDPLGSSELDMLALILG